MLCEVVCFCMQEEGRGGGEECKCHNRWDPRESLFIIIIYIVEENSCTWKFSLQTVKNRGN